MDISRRSLLQRSALVGTGLISGVKFAQASAPPYLTTLTKWWLKHEFFDPTSNFCCEAVFEESYIARAALRVAEQSSALARVALQRGAFAFCDRVVAYQGLQGYPYSLYMGYGLQVQSGMIGLSCVADQAAIANAALEACLFATDPNAIATWRAAIVNFVEWVKASFVNDNGTIASVGVGVYGYTWNPINPYWCATALFATTLIKLARLYDPNGMYSSLGLRCISWLTTYVYQNATYPNFSDVPTNICLYMMDGLTDGIVWLQDTGQTANPLYQVAVNQFSSLASYLVTNQTPAGRWIPPSTTPDPTSSVPLNRSNLCYAAGLAWQLQQMNRRLGGTHSDWAACAQKSMADMASSAGQRYYGLCARPFASGLAWLSFCESTF